MTEFVRSVLLIGVARIGDTLLLTPAMRAIKTHFPGAELTVLAHPKRKEILEGLPFIDKLQTITKKSAYLKGWWCRCQYDLAFVYGKDAELIRYALRVSKVVYVFKEEMGSLTPNKRLRVLSQPQNIHAVSERLALLTEAGINTENHQLAYQITPDEKAWANNWRKSRTNPLIALQIRSFPTKPYRDWPVSHTVRLIELIIENYPTATFVITGDNFARQDASMLVGVFGSRIVNIAGTLSLRQTAAILATVSLYVGVDTGPTHLAGALGIKMVSLYHAAHAGRNLAPLQHPCCKIIEHPETYGSASKNAEMSCISPEQVWEAARELLLLNQY